MLRNRISVAEKYHLSKLDIDPDTLLAIIHFHTNIHQDQTIRKFYKYKKYVVRYSKGIDFVVKLINVQNYEYFIQDIDIDMFTEENVKILLKSNPSFINGMVTLNIEITKELLQLASDSGPLDICQQTFKAIPSMFLNESIVTNIILNSGSLHLFIHELLEWTNNKNVAKNVLSEDGTLFVYFPKFLFDRELMLLALKSDNEIYCHLPECFQIDQEFQSVFDD